MAVQPQTGMEKPMMKRLLANSKKEPVSCAIGLGPDPAFGLLKLDKIKSPKAVEKLLLDEFKTVKNTRWGTALVDEEDDPKKVKLLLNRAVSGMARKLVKTLKGTGYTKVELCLEDGSVFESVQEEEDEATGAQAADGDAPADAVPDAPPPLPVDVTALRNELATLIPKIAAAANGDADRLNRMKALAVEATNAVKANDAAAAGAAIGALRDLIGQAPSGSASAAAPSASPPPPTGGGAVVYAKSRLAWIGTRQRMVTDIDKLRAALQAEYQDDPEGTDIMAAFDREVGPVLEAFDASLADKLDEATNAEDPVRRGELVAEAKNIIGKYKAYLDSEALIADLDDNPFVPLSIRKTVGATLTALEAAVR
jgi:hypothetical protein